MVLEGRDALSDAHAWLNCDRPRMRALLFGDAANIPRGMFDGAKKIARDIAARGAQLSSADPNRAARQTKSVEPPRPAKQRRVAISADVGENARRHMLGSRIARAAPGEEPRGNRVVKFQNTHQNNRTLRLLQTSEHNFVQRIFDDPLRAGRFQARDDGAHNVFIHNRVHRDPLRIAQGRYRRIFQSAAARPAPPRDAPCER